MSETLPPTPDAPRPAGPKRPSRGCLVACGIIAVVMTYLFTGPCTLSVITARARDYGNLSRMSLALRSYAKDHHDRLPPSLWELIPEYFTQQDYKDARYCDINKGGQFDWLYFPVEKFETMSPDAILLAAPGTSPGGTGAQRRLVWRPSHGAVQIPEADFQRLIREQNPPAASPPPAR